MEIKTFSPTSHKIKAVVYGASGSGKTFFAATAPKAIFASAEAGLLSTLGQAPVQYVEIKSMNDLRDLLAYLQKPGHGFESVVIDSISEINEIIKDGIEKKRGAQMILKDWNDLAKAIKGILRGFRDLDMHVIFIAQEKSEKDDQKTEKIVPMLNGKAAIEIAYFMDVVAYSFIDKLGEHKMTVQPNEKLLTKCRGIQLPPDAPLNFTAWIEAMAKIELKPEQVMKVDVPKKTAPASPRSPAQPAASTVKQRISAATSKELYAQWSKFYELTGADPKNAVASLSATIKRDLGKQSSRELTEIEALNFIERLKVSIEKRTSEAKAADLDVPNNLPQAPLAEQQENSSADLPSAIGKEVQTELPPTEAPVEVSKDDLKKET